jgi:hypothetical protein
LSQTKQSAEGTALSGVGSYNHCLSKDVISRFTLDVNTGRHPEKRETLDRKGEQSKMVMMGSVTERRTGTAIARPAKIIDRLR